MQTRTLSTLVAVFRTDADARAAADDLRNNGFGASDIFITAANTTTTNETVARDYQHHEGGIKGWFHSLFGEDQDETNNAAHAYESAIDTGNVLLSVETNEQNVDVAADVLNRHSPIDIHRDATVDDTTVDRDYTDASEAAAAGGIGNAAASTFGKRGTPDAVRASESQEAIPVVREELKVGKRAILRGGVRVYSRVVEQPVEETIGLREEHVRVDRTPVNREVTPADLRAGREQVVEVKEYVEEPVISKTARVVEEVRVRKDATERNETVRDTVRNTEVNVENLGTRDPYAGQDIDADYDTDFRRDFQQRYGTSGETYDTYAPAYTYGYQMANDARYRGRNFDDVESDLRTDYSQRYPSSTWERMKDSVRYGWNKLTHRS